MQGKLIRFYFNYCTFFVVKFPNLEILPIKGKIIDSTNLAVEKLLKR